MKRYVRKHIGACAECLMKKIPVGKNPGELHPQEPPQRPFGRVHVDHVGPFVKSDLGNMYVLVILDALTKFVKAYPVKSSRANENLKKFQEFINAYGIPRQVMTDRGSCFTSLEWKEFNECLGIKHTLTSTRWPQANGQVERVMKTLVPTIMTPMEE